MATNPMIPLPAPVGKISVKVDRIYGVLTIYPVDYNAFRFADLVRKKTLSIADLSLIRMLGFEVEFVAGAAAGAMAEELNKVLARDGFLVKAMLSRAALKASKS